VELGKMCCIDSFISENPINGEVLGWARFAGQAVENPCGESGGMSAKAEAETFVFGPRITIAD